MSGRVNGQPITARSIAANAAIDAEAAWRQLVNRDSAASFFYAVTTTGVFCRPSCKSRRPLKANVRYFRLAAEARAAGFRPCKRCSPEAASNAADFPLEKIRAYIEANLDRSVSLAELGRLVHRSPFTVQRHFKDAMGVSPLAYQRALRARSLRAALKKENNVTDAVYAAGFGSQSRAWEGAALGMTPTRFAQGGRGEQIGWCASHSPFGWVIVGATARGLCWLSLAASKSEAEAALRAEFPAAQLQHDTTLNEWVEIALAEVRGQSESPMEKPAAPKFSGMKLDLRGTAFQLRIWQALRMIPHGQTRTYGELARELGEPDSTRAVARACAQNRVALLVPCHRVIGSNGALTGYRWGVERKRQLLEAEANNAS